MTSNPARKSYNVCFKQDGTVEGEETTVAGIPAYVCRSADGQTANAILILSDLVGHRSRDTQLIADQFAANGYFVVVPDLLEGDPRDHSRIDDLGYLEWEAYGGLAGKGHSPGRIDPIVAAVIREMRGPLGVKRLGAVGYSLGAKFVARFAAEGRGIDVACMAYPDEVKVCEFEAMKSPLSVAIAIDDASSGRELEGSLKGMNIPYQIMLHSGVQHGFAVRCDTTKPHQQFARDATFLQHVHWLDEHVKRRHGAIGPLEAWRYTSERLKRVV